MERVLHDDVPNGDVIRLSSRCGAKPTAFQADKEKAKSIARTEQGPQIPLQVMAHHDSFIVVVVTAARSALKSKYFSGYSKAQGT